MGEICVKKSRKQRKRLQYIISYSILILLAIFFLFPIFCLFIKSIMPDYQLVQEPSLWPDKLNLKPYTKVFSAEYLGYFANTFFVCIMNIMAVCIVSSFTAYGLAKVKFQGRDVAFMIILSTVMLPGTVTSIPLYIIYDKLQWTGSLTPLWLPLWFGGGAMNIFLVRQFIRGIPNSLCEAATIDGANHFRIYFQIIIPLIRPILIYLAVTTFLGQWNDFQSPLMYVATNKEKWTISLALYQNFANQANSANLANVQMAAGVIMMIPGVILFAFFQDELMEGVATVGLKG